jgi:hypothetical protein
MRGLLRGIGAARQFVNTLGLSRSTFTPESAIENHIYFRSAFTGHGIKFPLLVPRELGSLDPNERQPTVNLTIPLCDITIEPRRGLG